MRIPMRIAIISLLVLGAIFGTVKFARFLSETVTGNTDWDIFLVVLIMVAYALVSAAVAIVVIIRHSRP